MYIKARKNKMKYEIRNTNTKIKLGKSFNAVRFAPIRDYFGRV